MDEPTQAVIVAALRLRGMTQVAAMLRILSPGLASLVPYAIRRMQEIGLVVYDESVGPESVWRLP